MSETIAVIDFETNGQPVSYGGRPTEIAAVLVQDGRIVDRYQSLMNAGVYIPLEIQTLTGISNAMVRAAPPVQRVMAEVFEFVGNYPLAAHNASFDKAFWDAELLRQNRQRKQEFACTMLLSRRVFPESPNHKLGTLVQYFDLPISGRAHRALADAEVTAHLLLRLMTQLSRLGPAAAFDSVTHQLLTKIQRRPRAQLAQCLAEHHEAMMLD
ncbi:MAG: 3'-5' exonuclease [Rhodocyclaceae bacterium]|nr:3'-5' exonuclease [Rhodocyclaceae bacterium]